VSTVLTSGRLSRLYSSLVLEQGLAVSIGSSNDTRVEGGCFWIYAECVQGVEPDMLEAAIVGALERLATEPVTRAELKRAKDQLAATEAYAGETVSDVAESLGEYAVDADWRDALRHDERRARIKARDVRDTVARYLRPERCVIGWSLPGARS
jgi:zinc protease